VPIQRYRFHTPEDWESIPTQAPDSVTRVVFILKHRKTAADNPSGKRQRGRRWLKEPSNLFIRSRLRSITE
jgi:hypothetical protein